MAALHPGSDIARRASSPPAAPSCGGPRARRSSRSGGGSPCWRRRPRTRRPRPSHAAYRELFRLLHAKGVAAVAEPDEQAGTDFAGSGALPPAHARRRSRPRARPRRIARGRRPAAAAQRRHPGVEHARAGGHGPPDHRAGVGGGPGSRPRWWWSTTAPRSRSRSPPESTATENRGVGGVEHGDRPVDGPGDRRPEQRLRGRARLGRGAGGRRTDGRRIAFPFTDHCDGQGFTRPDQAGTAGWCFALTRSCTTRSGRSTSGSARPSARTPTTGTAPGSWASSCRRSRRPASCTPAGRAATPGRPAAAGPPLQVRLEARRRPDRAPYYNREIVDYEPKPKWMRVRPGPGRGSSASASTRRARRRSTPRWRSSASRACIGVGQPPTSPCGRRWTRVVPCCRASIPRSTPSPTSGC